MKKNINWNYGENQCQKYYDTTVNGTYICVYANNWQPNIWLASVGDINIRNKTKNDRQRKLQGLPKGCSPHLLSRDFLLSSSSPEYMMKKAEHCFKYNKTEISA